MGCLKYFSLSILPFNYMTANPQIVLNELGLDKVPLGMNITDVTDAVPFCLFSERDKFNVYPADKHFYYLKGEESLSRKHLGILYTFLCIDDIGSITRLTMFLDDSSNETIKILGKLFGNPDLRGDASVSNNAIDRKHFIWSTNANMTVYMVKNWTWDISIQKNITVVHLYYPMSFENFGDYYIEYKYQG